MSMAQTMGPERSDATLVDALRRLWRGSALLGLAAAAAVVVYCHLRGHADGVWTIGSVGVGVIIYSIAFYAACALRAPRIDAFILREDLTLDQGDLGADPADDRRLDFYVSAYAAARGVSTVAASSAILIAVALALF